FPGSINRTDWIQIKDTLRQKRPSLRTAEFPSNVETHISMRTDQPPFKDVRVRQAVSLAIDRQGMIESFFEGVGNLNAAVPAGPLALGPPVHQKGGGGQKFLHEPAAGQRLLAAARRPHRLSPRPC